MPSTANNHLGLLTPGGCKRIFCSRIILLPSTGPGNVFKQLPIESVMGKGYGASWPVIQAGKVMAFSQKVWHGLGYGQSHCCFIHGQGRCIDASDQGQFRTKALTNRAVFHVGALDIADPDRKSVV